MAKKKRNKNAPSASKKIDAPQLGKKTFKDALYKNFCEHGNVWSLAVIFVCWLIQFSPVIFGGANFQFDATWWEYPMRQFSREALLSGQFPHWTPYVFNGAPFFAQINTSFLYPPNLLLSLMPASVSDDAFWYLIKFVIALHFLVAGVCMFFYLRYKMRSHIASLFGAIAFMFCGFIIAHTTQSLMVYKMAWFPLSLMFFERGVRECKFNLAVLGGLIFGIVQLAGHIQITFYMSLFLCAIGAYLLWRRSAMVIKRAACAALFFAVFAGITLVAYLPALELIPLSIRSEYSLQAASEGSMSFPQVLTALMPKFFGAFTGDLNIPRFWLTTQYTQNYNDYWETCFYFGISTLLLLLLWVRKIKQERAVIIVLLGVAATYCVALGGNFFVFRMLFDAGVPGIVQFRSPARVILMWNILFPIIAAAMLDKISELKTRPLKIASLSICAVFAIIGIIAATNGFVPLFPQMNVAAAHGADTAAIARAAAVNAKFASEQGIILFMNAILIVGVLALFFSNKISERGAKILFTLCIIIDMLIFAAGHHIAGDGISPYKTNQELSYEIRKQQKENPFRLNTRAFELLHGTPIGRQTHFRLLGINQGLVDGVQTMEGDLPLRLMHGSVPLNGEHFQKFFDLLNVGVILNPAAEYDRSRETILANQQPLSRATLFYRAKVLEDNDSVILAYMNSVDYDHRSEVVVTDEIFERFSDGQDGIGNVKITDYKLNRIELEVNTNSDAILWLSEIYYPAWKATVNGEKTEVYRANYSFRAIVVPAGTSKVVFKFDSTYFNIGAIVSLFTLIFALGYLVFVRAKNSAGRG